MTPRQFSQKLELLEPHPPFSSRFDVEMPGGKEANARAWYSSQKEHWLGWLAEYDGPGAYGRKSWRGKDAEFVYNHIVNPQMLVWLAEAAGASRQKLLRARRAALESGPRMQAMSAAIRRVFPFNEIEALLATCGSRQR
jgi:hypothetical protein